MEFGSLCSRNRETEREKNTESFYVVVFFGFRVRTISPFETAFIGISKRACVLLWTFCICNILLLQINKADEKLEITSMLVYCH